MLKTAGAAESKGVWLVVEGADMTVQSSKLGCETIDIIKQRLASGNSMGLWAAIRNQGLGV